MVPSCPHTHIEFKFYKLCLVSLLLLWVYEKLLFPLWLFPKLNSTFRFSHTLNLSSLKNPFHSSSCLIQCVLQHLEVLVAIPQVCSSLSMSVSLLCWSTLHWRKHSRWGLLRVKQMSSLSQLLAVLLLMDSMGGKLSILQRCTIHSACVSPGLWVLLSELPPRKYFFHGMILFQVQEFAFLFWSSIRFLLLFQLVKS